MKTLKIKLINNRFVDSISNEEKNEKNHNNKATYN